MSWVKSRRVQFLAGSMALFLLLFIVMRGIFYFGFSEVGKTVHPDTWTLLKTLFIGFKFDLRLAILLTMPLMVMAYFPGTNLVTSERMRFAARVYLALAVVAMLAFYIFDFGHYAYLGVRLNSTVLRFSGDAADSASMVWQSYPVLWILFAWVMTSVVFMWLVVKLERATLRQPGGGIKTSQKVLGTTLILVFIIGGLLGRFINFNIHNPVPLRWNHAFFSGNTTVSALGVNPVLFFYDTFEQREDPFDLEKVRHYYPVIASYLGVDDPDPESLTIDRSIGPQPHHLAYDTPPNVIFVMLESLGASRVGSYGNPLKPTPNLDFISENGWHFENFYVPVSGTAKTVFASITGLADVSSVSTATRNPLIPEQRVVYNALENYRKFYFIGGNAGWANMSAVVQQSIKDIKMYEEGAWQSPKVDVWGISDLDLFKELDEILADQPKDKPFFAYIQTAANHRPFTIPEGNDGFEALELPPEELNKWGFRSSAQFNAVRLLDFNIGRLLELAKASGYYENTIWVFFGDHNNRITTTPHMAPFFEELDLDGLHVPHMIFAPGLLEPRVVEDATSLVDVAPTVLGMLGLPYLNSTMGRDVSMPAPEGERVVFTQTADMRFPVIGGISKDYMVRMNVDGSEAKLHDLNSDQPSVDISEQFPERFSSMKDLARGIYESTRYHFYYNTVGEARRREE